MTHINNTVIVAAIAVIGLAVTAVFGLVALGRDPAQLIYFVSAIFPGTIGTIFLVSQVEKLRSDVTEVKENTNGNISDIHPDEVKAG